MKITMTIRVVKKIKEEFQKFAKDMGTNATNLLSMFMRDAVRRRELNFSGKDYSIEFENFSTEQLKDLKNDEEIKKNTKKMEKMLSNI